MENKLLQALIAHYNAEILKNEANLLIYFKSASGIGDHSNIVEEMIKLVDKIAAAKDSLDLLNVYVAPAPEAVQQAPVDQK